jgi:hypothetical protein
VLEAEVTLAEHLETATDWLTDEEARIARGYVEVLQKAGRESAEQLLETVSNTRAESADREMAFRLVAWLRIPGGGNTLAHALEKGEDDGFEWAAANALVQLRAQDAAEIVLRVLKHSSPDRQAAAAWVLGWLRVPAAIPSLRATAMSPQVEVDVRAHAIEALGVMQVREAVPDLVATLSNASPELRYWAAYSLGQIGDPTSIAELESVASRDAAALPGDRSIRQEALHAIDAIRERQHNRR